MTPEHHVIIVPGLGNGVKAHIWATNSWKNYGITPHVFDARWKIEEPDFQTKLVRAIDLVDKLTSEGKTISLVGNSAGSSFVMNLFGDRKNKIHRVVINCGRVRIGDWPWFTFDQATASSPSFKESVLRSERVISHLTRKDKQKILTLRPLFDEIVPPFTVPIDGANNEMTISVEHIVSIALNITLYRDKVLTFIKE
jgi:pimeloyl-ACP methyl ester carboxylesterase